MSRPSPKRPMAAGLARMRSVARLGATALAAILLSSPLAADPIAEDPVTGVVELFTSQGCASCPPADEMLTSVASDTGVLALSYHVDYWDYIGWRDPLSSPRSGERQRAYTNAMGQRTVYTPQVVVNGRREVKADGIAVRDALKTDILPEGRSGLLSLTKTGSTLRILAGAPQTTPAGAETVLVLVTYRRSTTTEVVSGENQGRRLVNTHAVRDWQIVGKMADKAVELDMPIASLNGSNDEPTECAILLQVMGEDGTPGAILAAARLAL